MNILILVPIAGIWINPEEIAAIESNGATHSIIRLKSNQQAISINCSAEDVIDRLKTHFQTV